MRRDVVMFLSFSKNKEPKCISVQIEKKINKKGPPFHFQKCIDQKYLKLVEITKNPQNPL